MLVELMATAGVGAADGAGAGDGAGTGGERGAGTKPAPKSWKKDHRNFD